MLKWLRKSSRSWFIYLAIGAIVVVFIFWGVGSYKSVKANRAAEVNGTIIPMEAFARQYNDLVKQYQERAGGELTPEMVKAMRLKEMALSQLVEEALVLQAAPRLGLEVTNAELRHQIQNYPYFQKDGKFDEKRYFWILSRSRMSPQDFEAAERQRILLQKVIAEVTSLAKVSDAELKELYRISKEEVEVNYLAVSPEKFLAQENPGAEAVAATTRSMRRNFACRIELGLIIWSFKQIIIAKKFRSLRRTWKVSSRSTRTSIAGLR